MLLIYNIIFPILFLLFLPGMIIKLINRPGYKKSYWERFAIFAKSKKEKLRNLTEPIWIHSVSVGETMIAIALIEKWKEEGCEKNIVLSTTTTTGQQLARDKNLDGVTIIYCPIDFILFVRKTIKLINPSVLIIFETEIWPNLINETYKLNKKIFLVNARMSDNSVKGYRKFKKFFKPLLKKIDTICVQTEHDKERFLSIEDSLNIIVAGNMKFDQEVPINLKEICFNNLFQPNSIFILAASTHPNEEELIAKTYLKLKQKYDNLKLIICPRHAERGDEIEDMLQNLDILYHRRTGNDGEKFIDCLLADTTGEMLSFINQSDIVIMGKSLAGHDEGHNLIEPALLAKPIITGSVLRNFRVVLNILKEEDALMLIDDDSKLENSLDSLISDAETREILGQKAKQALAQHKGATMKIIDLIN